MATRALDSKVQAQSLVDVVAERLEAAIISGQLEPGAKLSEQGLAASLGVSRGPLREAIRRLEGRKLLERTPNIGVRVAALSLKDLSEILQVRVALECLACSLAAQNMPNAEIAALKKLLDRHEQQECVQTHEGYYGETENLDFHYRIVHGSNNARLADMLTGELHYMLRVYRYKSGARPGRAAEVLQEHRAILAAIEARDPEAAEAAMREHLRHACEFVESQIAEGQSHLPSPPAKGRARTLG